ncbi:hypothetical protein [Tateyamaria sp. SN3-11]|uniref:hypothetical protein n=1 Tax=Tateyamaria sp. SN3-11 TaxID=3092147 RepID=UPI0039ED8CBD
MVWIVEDISTLALIFVGTCVATLIFAMLLSPKDNWRVLLGLIAGLAMLGCISGYLGGLSRTAAVGEIIPAALALAGGAAAYLFGADRSKGLIASICALALGLSLFLGFVTSTVKRGKVEAFQAHLTFCRDVLRDGDIMADTEAFVRVISLHGESCAGVIAADLAVARNLPPDAEAPDDFGYLVNAMNGLLARAGVEPGQ